MGAIHPPAQALFDVQPGVLAVQLAGADVLELGRVVI